MKIRNILAVATALSAVSVLAVNVSAYDLNKDLSTFWSASVTVPGGEFAEHNANNYIKVTYTVDESLADMAGHDYWCIKPMINDSGWPLIAGIEELVPSEDGSSYVIEPGSSYITFSIPADQLEHVQLAGIAFMGHGITLETLEIVDEAPASAPADTAVPDKTNPDTGVDGISITAALGIVAAAGVMLSRKRK